jgi:enoyl-CoA hydratase/carnithine racemase
MSIKVDREDSVDWITLNRPDKLNAIDNVMVEELCEYFSNIQEDYARRIVVIRGAGKGFCAGLDLASFDSSTGVLPPAEAQDGPNASLAQLVLKMRACPQPIVALINGAACGGGFSLALASDIRIASRSAKMNVAFVNLGLSGCELGTSYFLPRLVGPGVAAELMMTGRFIQADRALQAGLVSEVVDESELESAARALLADMLALSPVGLRKTKQTLEVAKELNDLGAVMALEEHTQLMCSLDSGFAAAASAFSTRKRRAVPIDRVG